MLMCSSRHGTVEGSCEFSQVIIFDCIGGGLEDVLRTNLSALKKKDCYLTYPTIDVICTATFSLNAH